MKLNTGMFSQPHKVSELLFLRCCQNDFIQIASYGMLNGIAQGGLMWLDVHAENKHTNPCTSLCQMNQ